MKIRTKDFYAVINLHSKDAWGSEISCRILSIKDNKLVFADSVDYTNKEGKGVEIVFQTTYQILNIQRTKDKMNENR